MELESKIWKRGKFWLVEVPAVEVMTQGYSQAEAKKMIADAIEGLVTCYFPDESEGFQVSVHEYRKGIIGCKSSTEFSFKSGLTYFPYKKNI